MKLPVKWDKKNYKLFIKELNKEEDKMYKEFNKKIVNSKYKMIGIKTPILRKAAKEISKTDIISFLEIKEKETYEEILLHGIVISYIKDIDIFIKYFDNFIKKIDNWALCDLCLSKLKIVKNNKKFFLNKIKEYIKKDEFICRVGIVLLLDYYIEYKYLDLIFNITTNLKREEYYVNMAIAWLLSICFIKYKDKTLKYLKESNLNKFVFNKTISKICDSYRVKEEDKIYLKSLKSIN